MTGRERARAEDMRRRLEQGALAPTALRAALDAVPPLDRDAWIDLVLGLEAPPDDGPELPRGCVPYLPCPVDALLKAVDTASVGPADLLVDLGSGAGRAAALVRLLAGASVVGVEVQPALVGAARALAARLGLDRLTFLAGDAAEPPPEAAAGSVFFLYCPFSGERLDRLLARLEGVARAHPIRICCVDLPLSPRPWLAPLLPPEGPVVVYRSAFA